MPSNSSSMRPQVVITAIVAVVLALLASFGVYAAAQPAANKGQQATFTYGSTS